MSKITERSPITSEVLDWSEVEGKHAQMHLVRRATLMAIDEVRGKIGIDEAASTETQKNSYQVVPSWRDALRRPHEVVHRGNGEREIMSKPVALGYVDPPEDIDQPYQFARLVESGRFNFEETSSRFDTQRSVKNSRDTYYRPDFEIRYFAGPNSGRVRLAREIPGSSVRMLDDLNLDVRFHGQWSPEDMVDHYERQIGQMAVFMDGLTEIAQAAGAYIHHSTELSYFLDPEEVANYRGI